MEAVQQSLRGWLGAEHLAELDFASAAAMMGSTGWLEGERVLQRAAGAGADEQEPYLQVDIEVLKECRVLQRKYHGLMPEHGCPEVGASLLDWAAAPHDLRISLQATLNDIRLGVVVAPLMRRLGGIVLQPPRVDGAGASGRRRLMSGSALFTGKGSRVRLRLWEFAGEHLSL